MTTGPSVQTRENAHEIRRWHKELAEGGHPQGRFALKGIAGYCCLGVYQEKVRGAQCQSAPSLHYTPEKLPVWMSPDDEDEFVAANDKIGLSFPQIAQRVKEKYPWAFDPKWD